MSLDGRSKMAAPRKTAGVYSFKLLLLYLQYPCQEKDLRHINEAIQLWLNLLLP